MVLPEPLPARCREACRPAIALLRLRDPALALRGGLSPFPRRAPQKRLPFDATKVPTMTPHAARLVLAPDPHAPSAKASAPRLSPCPGRAQAHNEVDDPPLLPALRGDRRQGRGLARRSGGRSGGPRRVRTSQQVQRGCRAQGSERAARGAFATHPSHRRLYEYTDRASTLPVATRR